MILPVLNGGEAVAGDIAPAAAPSSAEDLLKVVQQLWPEGLVEDGPVGADTLVSTSFAYVPSRHSARLLVPVPGRVAASRSLRKFSSSLSPREVVQRGAMSLALRLGGSAALRDRVEVLGENRSLRTWLSSWFGTEVTFSISIGTARVNRKPVLQVFDAEGRSLAFVKVGSSEQVVGDVQAEARALRAVEGRLPREIVAPRVLGTQVWENSFVMLLSPLTIPAWQPPRGRWEPPVRQMQLLNEAFVEPDRLLPETDMWHRLRLTCDELAPGALRSELDELLHELLLRSEGRAVRVGAWHGDWTSWNMARGRSRVLLWDWERFETGVPAGMDQCHFLVNVATRSAGFGAETIVAALDGLRPAGQHATATDLVVGAYLARLALRYTVGAQGPGGYLIARRAEILTQALDRWLSRSRR